MRLSKYSQTKRKRHLAAAVGSSEFRKVHATENVNNWYKEISKLSEFAKTQPHSAYSAILPW